MRALLEERRGSSGLYGSLGPESSRPPRFDSRFGQGRTPCSPPLISTCDSVQGGQYRNAKEDRTSSSPTSVSRGAKTTMRRVLLLTTALVLVIAAALAAAPTALAQGCQCTGQCELNGGCYNCGFCLFCCTFCTAKCNWCVQDSCYQPGGNAAQATPVACNISTPSVPSVPEVRVVDVRLLPART